MDAVAIIVAAGRGARMGEKFNKLLLQLGKSTILEKSIEPFLKHPDIHKIFLTINPKDRLVIEKIVTKKIVLIDGGMRRQDSVNNALRAVLKEKPIPDIVLIHDGARPFCSKKLISNVLINTRVNGTTVPVLPLVDTLRRIIGKTSKIVDRNELFLVQTPQGFQTQVLKEATAAAARRSWKVTDDAALVEKNGGIITKIDGDPINLN